MDQSDAGSTSIFSRWTNQTQEARVYSHDGPIGIIKCARKTSDGSQRKVTQPHMKFTQPGGGLTHERGAITQKWLSANIKK
eukprot:1195879-Prorocentrum_minimum.AAC.2